jgi:hypothetical protein
MPRDDGDLAIDARLPDGRGDIGLVDEDAAGVVEADGMAPREISERLTVPERNVVAHRKPRQRPVHRAGVEVAEPKALGQPTCDGALPRAGRPVDRDDHASSLREADSCMAMGAMATQLVDDGAQPR